MVKESRSSCKMSSEAPTSTSLSAGIQCELGLECYRNCLSFFKAETVTLDSLAVAEHYQDGSVDLKSERSRTSLLFDIKSEDVNDSEADQSSLTNFSEIEFCERVCGDCGLQFPNASIYEAHCKAHNKKEPFKCVECSYRFKKCLSLEEHRASHLLVKPYSCSDCRKEYSFEWSLQMHSQSHGMRPEYECGKCGLEFFSADMLSSHEHLHFVEGYSLDFEFNTINILNRKGENVGGSQEVTTSKFECEECNLEFATEDDLLQHFNCHTIPHVFKCQICFKEHKSYLELRQHVDSIHSEMEVHWCEDCGGSGYLNVTLSTEGSSPRTEDSNDSNVTSQNMNNIDSFHDMTDAINSTTNSLEVMTDKTMTISQKISGMKRPNMSNRNKSLSDTKQPKPKVKCISEEETNGKDVSLRTDKVGVKKEGQAKCKRGVRHGPRRKTP